MSPEPSRRAVMAVADAALLHQPRQLHPDEPVMIVTTPVPATPGPPHTLIHRWAELGTATVTARTVRGDRRVQDYCTGGSLLDDLSPERVLRRALTALGVDGVLAGGYAPVFCATAGPEGLHTFSRVRLHPEGAAFVRTSPAALQTTDVDDLAWLDEAVAAHARHALLLNSHDLAYTKCFPGTELEHKYNLPADAPIWDLAADAHARAARGELPGMVSRFRDDLEVWHYDNHLFEVTGPGDNSGYVSFLGTGDGTYRQKRKNFHADAFARHEHVIAGVRPDRTLDAYVRDVLELHARRLPSFRRIRYDVNVESPGSGHVYGVFFDRCHVLDAPDVTLTQCEIEYVKTRGVLPADDTRIVAELDELSAWVEQILAAHGITAARGCYSKLTFLRDAVTRRPGLLAGPVAATGDPR